MKANKEAHAKAAEETKAKQEQATNTTYTITN